MALLPLVYVDLSLSPSVVGGLSTFNAIASRPGQGDVEAESMNVVLYVYIYIYIVFI